MRRIPVSDHSYEWKGWSPCTWPIESLSIRMHRRSYELGILEPRLVDALDFRLCVLRLVISIFFFQSARTSMISVSWSSFLLISWTLPKQRRCEYRLRNSYSPAVRMSATTRAPETNGGVVTSWLPVSSAWPSVSQCSTEIYSQLGGGVAIGFDPYYGIYISTQVTCLPPYATSWWNQPDQTPAQTRTSIGPLVCPQLYTTAYTSVVNSESTFIACCPSYVQDIVLNRGVGANDYHSVHTHSNLFKLQEVSANAILLWVMAKSLRTTVRLLMDPGLRLQPLSQVLTHLYSAFMWMAISSQLLPPAPRQLRPHLSVHLSHPMQKLQWALLWHLHRQVKHRVDYLQEQRLVLELVWQLALLE